MKESSFGLESSLDLYFMLHTLSCTLEIHSDKSK